MLAIPAPPSNIEFGNFSEAGSFPGNESSSASRFLHTRAQLSAIARLYKPTDSYDSDVEGDDYSRVSPSLVSRVVGHLDEEREDDLKVLLKETFGMDDDQLEQHVLDLMHKHRDDIAGVPFLFLTPTRRPISRPSSRASSHSTRLAPNRPETPNSAPSSPRAFVFRRPHTPATSPLGIGQTQTTSYISAFTDSRPSSPTPSTPQLTHTFASSLPASPMSSPRLLNAKASEFRPIPRPLSAASSVPTISGTRAETPSPDLWAHNPNRPSSKLAIASPLVPDSTLLTRALTPSSSLRSSLRPDDDDDEDPFDPFSAKALPRTFHPMSAADFDSNLWQNSPNSTSSTSTDDQLLSPESLDPQVSSPEDQDVDPDEAAMLTDGMTPFDVLSSVFGASLAPSELEEALANNGYDFERAMSWLVDRQLPTPPEAPVKTQNMGGRVTLVSREGNGVVRGGRAGYMPVNNAARTAPRYINGRPLPGGNRVCRYFLAGECLRADCRFSHDLERALCRFWLRGSCAKGETCEFLHHLPNDVDVSGISAAMSRTELNPAAPEFSASPPRDEFPVLGMDTAKGRRGSSHYTDPSRARFASAVKRPAPAAPPPQAQSSATLAARRAAMGYSAEPLHHVTSIVAPKPSPRLKLRQPSLLPTLATGESLNTLYMAYRSRALQLGAARNACLSRAADAWRRGDGAAAKRFSREGHDLNAKMGAEMTDAAAKLIRERARHAEQAVKSRDSGWSDDPGDRTARGKGCGGGLGVILGISGRGGGGDDKKLTPEERTECMLDLHGLHSNEATDVLEDFLLALEQEHFYGLAFLIVGEEKHTGRQDPARGASRARLATGVREWLHRWGYPWNERDGIICVDPLTHQ
ncbi:hypothetical protein JAAARDRAFT_31100 [Jaapia argillacea MUCL 33604]|uniref:Uncharacterized protein n=1 Tax=Jaapia argillacea MUCL 33604 TaxID=933084 RepID=A0A067Q619_9AGAM|nr:hypothetical protein JAAARDRAFT_31100 [Jaapia argillacea MUCL 33604]